MASRAASASPAAIASEIASMLALEGFEIGALALRPMRGDADALPRDDEAAEIFEKMRELRVAGRRGDRPVKGEILVDRAFAADQRGLDRRQRLGDPPPRGGRAAIRRQSGGLDLDAGAQLHDVEHLGD